MSTSGNSGLHRLLAGTVGAGRLFSTCLCAPPELMNVVTEDTMTDYPDVLVNKSPEQLRQRARWALMPTRRETVPPRVAPRETTAEAIAVFDAQFPWLRGAEKRLS
jgi:hypothetical protein